MVSKIFSAVLLGHLFFMATISHSNDTISIKDAIDKGFISVLTRSLGGHTDECLEMTIENTILKDMVLRIDAGRCMISQDSSMQDILITMQYDFLLSKTETARLNIFGMCMKASRRSPAINTMFTVGRMADSLLVQLAGFINKYNYRNTASQSAVWVLSDGHQMESIHADLKDTLAKKMLHLMHKLSGQPVPWYSLTYVMDTAVIFTGKAETLHGLYEYYVPANSIGTLGIYRENGHLQTILFSQRKHDPGKYDYPFVLDVSQWGKGNYYLKFYVDDQVKEKRLIKL